MTTIPALIRALHAAGWSYRITHEESPRDADGAPFDDGCYVHSWTRGECTIDVPRKIRGPLVGCISYRADEHDSTDGALVGVELVQRHGADILRVLGDCVGVFEPDDPAWRPRPSGWVERPAPVGSWWEAPDGAAYVDGDYLDGPGDQIVTFVLHRRDGSRAWGKAGGREFAHAYTRLDGPPDWYTPDPDAALEATR
ncbi:hypothetical protein [Dactylosporangium sp. CA-139066]|uniref:hypothetical protein n=1 Tax=Dactylosporangium sp. CA-139066 TaxID=3239930 RepID=UPI003D912DD9